MSDILRLFIALPLPSEVKQVLHTQQAILKTHLTAHEKAIRWTTHEQWHLTLTFLGATNSERLPQIHNAMQRTSKAVKAFVLETTTLGAFPSLSRPSIVWLGVGGDTAALQTLQQKLQEALSGMIELENRSFQPHVTLARLNQFGLGQQINKAFSKTSVLTQAWTVKELCLYQSVLQSAGATYTPIHHVMLQ